MAEKVAQLFDPQPVNQADFDVIIQIMFDDPQDFVRLKSDPTYREKILPDHHNFADTTRGV